MHKKWLFVFCNLKKLCSNFRTEKYLSHSLRFLTYPRLGTTGIYYLWTNFFQLKNVLSSENQSSQYHDLLQWFSTGEPRNPKESVGVLPINTFNDTRGKFDGALQLAYICLRVLRNILCHITKKVENRWHVRMRRKFDRWEWAIKGLLKLADKMMLYNYALSLLILTETKKTFTGSQSYKRNLVTRKTKLVLSIYC